MSELDSLKNEIEELKSDIKFQERLFKKELEVLDIRQNTKWAFFLCILFSVYILKAMVIKAH